MCGIVGCYGRNARSISLEKSLEKLLDRGPDSNEICTPYDFLTLGAARLAMTDPHERSNQPFTKNGDWLVFNGEIYNYKQIRAMIIEEFGVNFLTSSDTEVLIEVLRLYGVAGIAHLKGMFAFAYFNGREEQLLLARDSLGKKPLFYLEKDDKIFWASTIPSLRELRRNKELNLNSVVTFLSLGYTLDPDTIYSNIHAVKPGYCYKFDNTGSRQEFRTDDPKEDSLIEDLNLDLTLRRSVLDRIDGHNQVAVSLSGGLDSSVVAMLSAETRKRIVAFSLCWSDSDKDRYNTDYHAAKLIAKNIGIEFIGVDFSAQNVPIAERIRKFLKFMGEPNSNPTGISLIPLYQEIADKGFRLVLTGDGADEIFGGYPRYFSKTLGPRMRVLSENTVLSMTKRVPHKLEKGVLRFSNADYPGLWANFHWNFRPKELVNLISVKLQTDISGITETVFRSIRDLSKSSGTSESKVVANIMEKDRRIWLTNESNRKLDRISMAYSIEARSPFQDERVIELGKKLMSSSGYLGLGKKILWETYPNLSAIGVRKDKAGFISPVGHWLRSNPTMVYEAIEALDSSGLFYTQELRKRQSDQFSGDFERIRQLWSLVILGQWLRMQE